MEGEILDVFFDDLGVEVTFGSSTFRGIFDMPDESIAGGLVLTTEYSVTVKSVDVVGVIAGDEFEINGELYEVRQVRKYDDGKLSHVALSKK